MKIDRFGLTAEPGTELHMIQKASIRWTHLSGCVIVVIALLGLQGCGQGGPSPQPAVEADRLKTAQELRSFFVKANGDYSTLSPSDKTAFAKLAGGESKAEYVFNAMKSPVHVAQQGTSGGQGTP